MWWLMLLYQNRVLEPGRSFSSGYSFTVAGESYVQRTTFKTVLNVNGQLIILYIFFSLSRYRFLSSSLHGCVWKLEDFWTQCFLFFTDPDPVTGDMESAMAVELNPWVEYEFRVVATNAIGTGDPSAPSRLVRTKEAGACHFTTHVQWM